MASKYTIESPLKIGGKVRKSGTVSLEEDAAAELVAAGIVSPVAAAAKEPAKKDPEPKKAPETTSEQQTGDAAKKADK